LGHGWTILSRIKKNRPLWRGFFDDFERLIAAQLDNKAQYCFYPLPYIIKREGELL